MPSDVMQRFHSDPDEMGVIDWHEIDYCPLYLVDNKSPHYDPGWFSEVMESVSVLNMDAPHSWIPSKPSAAFRQAVVMIKSEQEHAAAYRVRKNEEW